MSIETFFGQWAIQEPKPMSNQTNLDMLLDQIEERGRLSYNSEELRMYYAALVKALREAINVLKETREIFREENRLVLADAYNVTLSDITAILQASSDPKREKSLEEPGGEAAKKAEVPQMELSELSDEQLNIKLAKFVGWKLVDGKWWHDDVGDGPPTEACKVYGRALVLEILRAAQAAKIEKQKNLHDALKCERCGSENRSVNPLGWMCECNRPNSPSSVIEEEKWTERKVENLLGLHNVDWEAVADAHNASLERVKKALEEQGG